MTLLGNSESDKTYLVTLRLHVQAPNSIVAEAYVRSRLWRLGRKPAVEVRSLTVHEDVLIREKAA